MKLGCILNESDTEAECRRRKVVGAIRSLVISKGLQLV